jgi:hypothetical protein
MRLSGETAFSGSGRGIGRVLAVGYTRGEASVAIHYQTDRRSPE